MNKTVQEITSFEPLSPTKE